MVTYYTLILEMIREFLFDYVSIGYEHLHYGLGKPFHVTFPDLRVRTFKF